MPQQPLFDDLSAKLNSPLLELGSLSITTFFLVKAVVLLAALVVTATLVRKRLVFRLLRKSSVDEGVKYAVARISGYGVWILGFLIALPVLGIELNTLLVTFGAVGIGIGLGLQKIAENFISGMILLFGRPVKVGDRIRTGGTEGTVVEIKSRVTLLRTNDNIMLLVPNAHLISDLVVNLTHDNRVVRFGFEVGVSYESDPDAVRACLLEVARANPMVIAEPPPDVFFLGFGDSSLNFRLVAFSVEAVPKPDVLLSAINFAIWYRLKEAGITIPFPQRDLHIRSIAAEAMRALPGA